MYIGQLIKRKRISVSRSVENILEKGWLKIEVQPEQTNRVERVVRFVNVHLYCIVSNLKSISKFSMLPALEKSLRTPMAADGITDYGTGLAKHCSLVFCSFVLQIDWSKTFLADHAITCGANGSTSFICLWSNARIAAIGGKVRFHQSPYVTLYDETKVAVQLGLPTDSGETDGGQGGGRPPWPVILKFLGPLSPHC